MNDEQIKILRNTLMVVIGYMADGCSSRWTWQELGTAYAEQMDAAKERDRAARAADHADAEQGKP